MLALVGCVRLWDLGAGRSRLRPNGAIICQSEAYVSWFSTGDPALGEKAIILYVHFPMYLAKAFLVVC
jgi:hypothetical protein